MDKQISNDFLAGKYERTEEGIYFPKSRMLAQGVFKYNKRGEEEESSPNLVVNEGLDYLLAASIGLTSPIGSWYVALYTGDVTVLASWTGATWSGLASEWTDYVNVTRPDWQKGAVSGGGANSFNNKAEFESNSATQVIFGAALISVATKGGSGDAGSTLIAASNFSTSKSLDVAEILDVGYGLQLTAVVTP